MPKPRPLSEYQDIQEMFNHLAELPGPHLATLEFESNSAAQRFRFRMYEFRHVLRKISKTYADSPDPAERLLVGTTPYDKWNFRIAKGESTIEIWNTAKLYKYELFPNLTGADPNAETDPPDPNLS